MVAAAEMNVVDGVQQIYFQLVAYFRVSEKSYKM
jgi:hypothetical protein